MSIGGRMLLAALVGGCGGEAGGGTALGPQGQGEGGGVSGGEGEGGAGEAPAEGEGEASAAAPPIVVATGDAISVAVLPLAEGRLESRVAWPGGWVAEGPGGLRRFDGQAISSLGEGPEGLSAAVPLAGGVLMATSTGLWFVGDAAVALSPLDGAVAGVVDLAVGGEDLWLAGADGLHRWRDGDLVSVRLGGAAVGGARVAVSGAHVWVATEDALWRLWEEAEAWRAEIAAEGAGAQWLVAGVAGSAWTSNGVLVRHVTAHALQEYAVPPHAGLAAAAGDVWLWSVDGVWRLAGETLWPLEGVSGVAGVAAEGAGSVLVAGATGLLRVSTGEAPAPPEAPTWTGDVRPLFEAQCEICHGARSNARRLETREAFAGQIDLILPAVREARMPLPPNDPLSVDDIDMLERWRSADFPE